MTDMKQVPENLKELEQKAAFKSVYKKHTVEQLQELLLEANTDYLSDDNKAALVWRYMDAKGMAFDEVAINGGDEPQTAPIEPNDSQTDTPAAAPEAETVVDPEVKQDEVSQDDQVVTEDTPASDNDQPETTPDAPAKEEAPAEAAPVKADYVAIENTGAFNFLETATSTLVRAKEVTKVYPNASVTKAQILRNVEQYNYTRGAVLKIVN